jgi:hypothetical protein
MTKNYEQPVTAAATGVLKRFRDENFVGGAAAARRRRSPPPARAKLCPPRLVRPLSFSTRPRQHSRCGHLHVFLLIGAPGAQTPGAPSSAAAKGAATRADPLSAGCGAPLPTRSRAPRAIYVWRSPMHSADWRWRRAEEQRMKRERLERGDGCSLGVCSLPLSSPASLSISLSAPPPSAARTRRTWSCPA